MTTLPRDALSHDSGQPLLAYYGDDFTGSTDALAALHEQGVATLLFLRPPDAAMLAAARRWPAVGLAGVGRSLTPAAMRRELPAAFAVLASLQPALLHYKVCSTFDSAPTRGSIGCAMELGRAALAAREATPIVVGAPALRRYTAFGHLYAAFGDTCWRLDRHPTMSRHPVTPMREADLLRHLAAQTRLRGELLDFVTLARADAAGQYDASAQRTDMLLLDVLDEASQLRAGQLLWRAAQRLRAHNAGPLFCVGSSGLSSALVAAWRDAGLLGAATAVPPAAATDAVAAVSGSCAPQTAAQIAAASAGGYDCVRVDMTALLTAAGALAERARVLAAMTAALAQGRSALAYTASGPQDPAIARWQAALPARRRAGALKDAGRWLGELLHSVCQQSGVQRLVVAGGDTSGHVAGQLGVAALTLKATLAAGAPLCQGWADAGETPRVELVLKGGQMGDEDFFVRALHGAA